MNHDEWGHEYDDRDWCRACGIGRTLAEETRFPCEEGRRLHPRCPHRHPNGDQCTGILGNHETHSNDRHGVELREWPVATPS